MNIKNGDYCIATKWQDGDPQDQWAVGFYSGLLPKSTGDRHLVVDSEGHQFRANGFRRVEKISSERGALLVKLAKRIEQSGRSVWYWRRLPIAKLQSALD